MPLNLYNGGNVVPHIRYMAEDKKWALSTVDGKQEFDLPLCIFDLANIKTGWGAFAENSPPQWVWDDDLATQNDKPDEKKDWKRGFRVDVLLPQEYGKDRLREFATTATGAVEGIKALYAQYENEAPANPGKVPVVHFQGTVPSVIGKGRTNIPTLVIVNWVDRPEALKKSVSPTPAPAAPQPSPQPAASPVQPPSAPAATDQGNLATPVF